MNIIDIQNVTAQRHDKIVFDNISWILRPNENWAIIGKTGAGKTSFIDLIMGKMTVLSGTKSFPFLEAKAEKEKGYFRLAEYVAVVRFNISVINYKQFYYQQRYYSSENEGVQTVRDFLKISNEKIFNLLKINDLLDLELNKLSNGQTRKMYIAKALLRQPQLLILDNPFLGLDVEARSILQNIIEELITEGYQIMVICNHQQDIPACMSKVLLIDNFTLNELNKNAFHTNFIDENKSENNTSEFFLPALPTPPFSTVSAVIDMKNVVIKYDKTAVLNTINWQVKTGEKWALLGGNGSGKSTLLSLIFGDHPQAYANDIWVFDEKRGAGNSIWDIKKRIGFVSPELHLYFTKHISNFMLVTDGVAERADFARHLFDYYDINALKKQDFQHTSTGEQRLILLLKALAQNPELLILDEPFQGMDKATIEKSQHLINAFCENRTLIIVTHYEHEIPLCVDRFLHLKDGEIIIS